VTEVTDLPLSECREFSYSQKVAPNWVTSPTFSIRPIRQIIPTPSAEITRVTLATVTVLVRETCHRGGVWWCCISLSFSLILALD
jgi:hypothetical protein